MAHLIATLPVGADLKAKLADVFAEYQDKLERRKLYRQTLTELQSLSMRELADIGINRSEIRGIAYRAAYGE